MQEDSSPWPRASGGQVQGRGVAESTCLAVDCIGFMSLVLFDLGQLDCNLSEPQFFLSVRQK